MALQINYKDRFGVEHSEAYLRIISANVEKSSVKTSGLIPAVYETVIIPAVYESTIIDAVVEDGIEISPQTISSIEIYPETSEEVLISEEIPEVFENKLVVKSTAGIYHSKDTTNYETLAIISIDPTVYENGNVYVESYNAFKTMFENTLDV